MNKKFFYGIVLLILFLFAVFLAYLKFTQKDEININTPVVQTIIPERVSQIHNKSDNYEQKISTVESRVFLKLSDNETFIDAISEDLNNDNIEDQIIAVKKLLDPFLYLIISIQDPQTQKWERLAEIKTSITEPKSLNFNIIKLTDSLPAITYSGMTSDNRQSFAIQKIEKAAPLAFNEIISLTAEIKIQVKTPEASDADSVVNFSSFKIYAFDSDPEAPNSLNQIQTEYVWSNRTKKYEKSNITKISGEKIEYRLLQKLKTGNTESIIDFLSGLWFKEPETKTDKGRSFYFDDDEKIIIFNLDNIEEIFEISSMTPLRYGMFFFTHNKSIPSIIRRISIEVRGVDEIHIRVIEDVRRLKFGASSVWNGNYKKNTGIETPQKDNNKKALNTIRHSLEKSKNEWTNNDNATLNLEGKKYRLTMYGKPETGVFNILEIKGKFVLQLRSSNGTSKFYLAELNETGKKQILSITKVKINIEEIISEEDETIILNREI